LLTVVKFAGEGNEPVHAHTSQDRAKLFLGNPCEMIAFMRGLEGGHEMQQRSLSAQLTVPKMVRKTRYCCVTDLYRELANQATELHQTSVQRMHATSN
jgi:hypothetical protein